MNKTLMMGLLGSFLAFLALPSTLSAQGCMPDTQYTSTGFYPTNLPAGCPNEPYSQVMTVVVPADTVFSGFNAPIDSMVITNIGDLPPGISFECNASGLCQFPGGQSGCIRFFGTPTVAGTYGIDVDIIVYGKLFNMPVSLPFNLVDTFDIVITDIMATTSSTPANCGVTDGSASVTPSAMGTYGYLWSNGSTDSAITNVAGGSYTVTVTDSTSGCTKDFSVVVSSTSGGAAVDSASSTFEWTGCAEGEGGSLSPSVSGGSSPLSFSWSNGDTTQNLSAVAAGPYTLTVTDDNQCVTVQEFVIEAPAVMSLSIVSTDENFFGANDGTAKVIATGGEGPYNYSWPNSSTADSIGDLAPGSYTVTVTDALGCLKEATANIGARPVSKELAADLQSFKVYPNPTQGQVNVSLEMTQAQDLSVKLLDMQGRTVMTYRPGMIQSWNQQLTLPSAGVFMIVVETKQGRTVRQVVGY